MTWDGLYPLGGQSSKPRMDAADGRGRSPWRFERSRAERDTRGYLRLRTVTTASTMVAIWAANTRNVWVPWDQFESRFSGT